MCPQTVKKTVKKAKTVKPKAKTAAAKPKKVSVMCILKSHIMICILLLRVFNSVLCIFFLI